MAWQAAIPVIVAAIGQYMQQQNGGSSQSGQLTRKPASWSSVGPGASMTWDDFIMNFYGMGGMGGMSGITEVENREQQLLKDRDALVAQNGQRVRTGGGRDMPVTYTTIDNTAEIAAIDQELQTLNYQKVLLAKFGDEPGYQSRLEEDIAYQEGVGERFLESMDAADTRYTERATSATQTFLDSLDTLTKRLQGAEAQYLPLMTRPTMQVKMGGAPVNIIPKRNIMAGSTAMDNVRSNVGSMFNMGRTGYSAEQALADALYGVDSRKAQRVMQHAAEFTPNKGYMQYMDKLLPIVNMLQGYRFGLPSESGNLSYKPSWMQTLGEGLETGTALMDLVNSIDWGDGTTGATSGQK